MDPLGLLLAIVAVAVYPGGLFLACLAWLTWRLSGMPRATGLDRRGLVAVCVAVVAASMAMLPGSPAAALPPPGGATPNLVAAVLLLFVAGALTAPDPWSSRRIVVVALGGVSLLLLGFVAASFSIDTLSGAYGSTAAAARIVVAIGILAGLPVIVQPHRAGWIVNRPGDGGRRRRRGRPQHPHPGGAARAGDGALGRRPHCGSRGLRAVLRLMSAVAQREHLVLVVLAAACASAGSLAAIFAGRAT